MSGMLLSLLYISVLNLIQRDFIPFYDDALCDLCYINILLKCNGAGRVWMLVNYVNKKNMV